MTSRARKLLLAASVLVLIAAVPQAAQARTAYCGTGKPALSGPPHAGTPFTISGVVTPTPTKASHTVVKIKLLALTNGRYREQHTYRATLSKGPAGKGGVYSCAITIPEAGRHAVRALHYRFGRLASSSRLVAFGVTVHPAQIAVDSDSHADVVAQANAPIDVVFHSPSGKMCGKTVHFLGPELMKTSDAPLTYHCDGLAAGNYAWQCTMGPQCCGGSLIVKELQKVAVDSDSHADVVVEADTPLDVVFHSASGRMCGKTVHFLGPELTKTGDAPLTYHASGLAAGSYSWQCDMGPQCCSGKLVASSDAPAMAATAYSTSKPALSATPHMNKAFTCSGVITPKSTSSSRATVKIILWMKNGSGGYGVMKNYWAKLGSRPAGQPGTKYSCSITIPMKGPHGVQAVQYRGGKQVSKSSIKYFTVQP